MTRFTSRISSNGKLTIPQNVRDMNQFKAGDLLELEIKKVRRVKDTDDGETEYQEPEKPMRLEEPEQ